MRGITALPLSVRTSLLVRSSARMPRARKCLFKTYGLENRHMAAGRLGMGYAMVGIKSSSANSYMSRRSSAGSFINGNG